MRKVQIMSEKDNPKEQTYSWFVSYTFNDQDGRSGNGRLTIDTYNPTLDRGLINTFTSHIAERNQITNVVIANIIPLPMIHPEYSNPCK